MNKLIPTLIALTHSIFSLAQGQNSAWLFEEQNARSLAHLGGQQVLLATISDRGVLDYIKFDIQSGQPILKKTHGVILSNPVPLGYFLNSSENSLETIGNHAYHLAAVKKVANTGFYHAGLFKISLDSLNIVDTLLIEDTAACCTQVWVTSLRAINGHEFIALGYRRIMPTGRIHPFVAKVDTSLTLLEFKYFDESGRSILFQSFMVLPDGGLIIGASVRENSFVKGAVYKLDNLWNTEWTEIFETRTANPMLTDGEFFVTPSQNQNEFWAIQHRAMHCDGRQCNEKSQYRKLRLIKMDLQGSVISETLFGPKMRGIRVASLDADTSRFAIAGTHHHTKKAVGFVFDFSNQGDSLWLTEPNIEQYRSEFHTLNAIRKVDGINYTCGQVTYPLNPVNWSHNTFLAALNQNGCYLNNVCPGYKVVVEENHLEVVKIYPNPAYDKFYISPPGANITYVEIYDVTGARVYSEENLMKHAVDISRLPSGIYFVVFSISGKQLTQKLVKH